MQCEPYRNEDWVNHLFLLLPVSLLDDEDPLPLLAGDSPGRSSIFRHQGSRHGRVEHDGRRDAAGSADRQGEGWQRRKPRPFQKHGHERPDAHPMSAGSASARGHHDSSQDDYDDEWHDGHEPHDADDDAQHEWYDAHVPHAAPGVPLLYDVSLAVERKQRQPAVAHWFQDGDSFEGVCREELLERHGQRTEELFFGWRGFWR